MDYHCKVCVINPSRYRMNISILNQKLKEIDNCKQIKLNTENPLIKDIDRIFYAYIIEHNKKID